MRLAVDEAHPAVLIRLTAFELQSLKIPSTMLCDSMVGSLFQHHQIHGIGEN